VHATGIVSVEVFGAADVDLVHLAAFLWALNVSQSERWTLNVSRSERWELG